MKVNSDSRRQFLKSLTLGGGATLLASCAGGRVIGDNGGLYRPYREGDGASLGGASAEECVPAASVLPDGLDPSNFHVHNNTPLALETKRSTLMTGAITPAALLFVRNNLPRPDKSILDDRDGWALEVKGAERAGSISLAELKRLGRETTTAVLQCSGNGRAFFGHAPSGSQWSVGAAGCVNWTGVRLSEVAAHFGGPVNGTKYVTATGGEVLPPGVDPKAAVVERSIPVEKGLNDVLLAWEMNGQPIPITHGGPLRMVVPGYFGCNQIKYIKTLSFSLEQSDAKIMKKGYRFRPLGEKGNASQPSLWRMPVKSWVNGPGADETEVLAGQVYFHGVAFSGERGVRGVEVSMDDGKSWKKADIYGPDMGKNAWRTFKYAVELEPGDHRIVSRATDTQGDVQSAHRDENERGYRYNGWSEAGLDVRVVPALAKVESKAAPVVEAPKPAAPKGDVTLSEAGERGKAVFNTDAQPGCGVCHTLSDADAVGTVGPSLDDLAHNAESIANAVSNGVGIMPSFGNTLTSDQIADLATYVVEASR
jgi:DMSO/TMAO reductase YedYZ molybdopterin-dependent catalytic subunit